MWSVRITKQSPLGEILTNLVVMARLGGVPVAEEDDQEALTWVRSVMQRAYGRWVLNLEAREQLVDDLLSAVYEAVLTRFDLPDTNQSLQRFIFITAQGLAKDLYKKARRMYLAELMHGDTDGEISQDDADDVGDESDKSKPGQGWGRRLEPFGYQLEP
jgi:DNA-directed RNA polymerase specialized sigma24 family protein